MTTINTHQDLEKERRDLQSISELIDKRLELLKGLSIEEKKAKNEDVKKMVEYFNKLTDNIENRRIRAAETTWQTLGILVTAFGVIVALDIISLLQIFIFIVLGIQIIFSFARIFEYQKQSKFRYPFLELKNYSNKWKWFYYANPFITKINTDPWSSRLIAEDREYYLEGLEFFISRYTEEDINKEISDNLIQLYLLQVHNYFKNKFYLRLFKYDNWMLVSTIIVLVIYVLFIIIVYFYYPGIWNSLLTKSI